MRISYAQEKQNLKKLSDTYLDLRNVKHDTLNITDSKLFREIINRHKKYQVAYMHRLQKLIDICRENNILPVLITQPLLIGHGVDSISGAFLKTLKFNSHHNGKSFWMLMESYNDVTRETAIKNNILLIDAANLMPKNSLYFYDALHYTNSRGNTNGQPYIYSTEIAIFTAKYPSYLKNLKNTELELK